MRSVWKTVATVVMGWAIAGLDPRFTRAADTPVPREKTAEKPADKPVEKSTAKEKAAAQALPKIGPATHPAVVTVPAEPSDMVKIFNGVDLTGWDGDPRLWSAKDGCLRGETTKEVATKGNTFCIYTGVAGGTGAEIGDFELRLTYRISGGNSGVQYRSKRFTDPKASNSWVVGGYQAEIAGGGGRDGYIYEERGKRGRMCMVGEKVLWTGEGKKLLGLLDDVNSIAATYKHGGWNEYVIIARGNHLQHWLNGVQTIDCVDEDAANMKASGVIAMQIHAGGPMVIEMKDIRLKKYEPAGK